MAAPERSYEDLIEALKAWAQYNDPNVRAALNLLIRKESFRRRDLVEACVEWPGQSGAATVNWFALISFADGQQPPGSDQEIWKAAGLLGFDGPDNWRRWLGLSLEDRTSLVRAFAEALDTDPASLA